MYAEFPPLPRSSHPQRRRWARKHCRPWGTRCRTLRFTGVIHRRFMIDISVRTMDEVFRYLSPSILRIWYAWCQSVQRIYTNNSFDRKECREVRCRAERQATLTLSKSSQFNVIKLLQPLSTCLCQFKKHLSFSLGERMRDASCSLFFQHCRATKITSVPVQWVLDPNTNTHTHSKTNTWLHCCTYDAV